MIHSSKSKTTPLQNIKLDGAYVYVYEVLRCAAGYIQFYAQYLRCIDFFHIYIDMDFLPLKVWMDVLKIYMLGLGIRDFKQDRVGAP